MNSFFPNYFIHAANVLLLVAYSVRDILWLRLFAVGAALISIPYFVLQPTTLWAPLSCWEVGALERYLTANPETRTVMLQHVARDLAAKVERVTAASSKPLDKQR